MNERIKEFEAQCWEARQYGPPWFDAKKFAELIVKECNEVLRLVPYTSDRDFGDEAIYQEAIYKHFGVKE